jgi:large subunit ribosomal protein L28
MSRKCTFTGKRPNVGFQVSHSNHKTKKRQLPNLQGRRLWWAEGNRFVRLRLSTRALRSIDRLGLQAYADTCGVDLSQY